MADGPALWSKPSGRDIALPHAGTMELWNYGPLAPRLLPAGPAESRRWGAGG